MNHLRNQARGVVWVPGNVKQFSASLKSGQFSPKYLILKKLVFAKKKYAK